MEKRLTYRERRKIEQREERTNCYLKKAIAGLLIVGVAYFGEGVLNGIGSRENQRMAKSMNVPITKLDRLGTDLLGAYSLVKDPVKEMKKKKF